MRSLKGGDAGRLPVLDFDLLLSQQSESEGLSLLLPTLQKPQGWATLDLVHRKLGERRRI